MKVKYSDIINLEINGINEISYILNLSIKNAKKYGDSFCEIGKVLISFGKSEFNNKIEVYSYIHIKNGGAYIRAERNKKELLYIIIKENNL